MGDYAAGPGSDVDAQAGARRAGAGLDDRECRRFSKPKHERAWATRAVLGEEMWLVERPRDAALAVNAGGTAFLAAALVAARKRTLVPAVAATAGAMALIMVYWKQMADYDDTAENEQTGANCRTLSTARPTTASEQFTPSEAELETPEPRW